jgi:hypothetical protein
LLWAPPLKPKKNKNLKSRILSPFLRDLLSFTLLFSSSCCCSLFRTIAFFTLLLFFSHYCSL